MSRKNCYLIILIMSFLAIIFQLSNQVYAKDSEFEFDSEKCEELTKSDIAIDSYNDYKGENITYNSSTIFASGDDVIVEIVPRELFYTEGSYAYYGQEYGFIIQTKYNDELKKYDSTVIVLDFEVDINTNIRGENSGYVYSYNIVESFSYDYVYIVDESDYTMLDLTIDESLYERVVLVPTHRYSYGFTYSKSNKLYISNTTSTLVVSNLNELNPCDVYDESVGGEEYQYQSDLDTGCYITGCYVDYSFSTTEVYCVGGGGSSFTFDWLASLDVILKYGVDKLIPKINKVAGIVWELGNLVYDATDAGIVNNPNYQPERIVVENENYVYKTDLEYFGDADKDKIACQSISSPAVSEDGYLSKYGVTFSYILGGVERTNFDPTRFECVSIFDIKDENNSNVLFDNVLCSPNTIDSQEFFATRNTVSEYNYSVLSAKNVTDSYITKNIDTKFKIDLDSLYCNGVFAGGLYTIEKQAGLADFEIVVAGKVVDYFEVNELTDLDISIRGKGKYNCGKLKVKLVPYDFSFVYSENIITYKGQIIKIRPFDEYLGVNYNYSILNEDMSELPVIFENNNIKYYRVVRNSDYYLLNNNDDINSRIQFDKKIELFDGRNDIDGIGIYFYDCNLEGKYRVNSTKDCVELTKTNLEESSNNSYSKYVKMYDGDTLFVFSSGKDYELEIDFYDTEIEITGKNPSTGKIDIIKNSSEGFRVQRGETYKISIVNGYVINYLESSKNINAKVFNNYLELSIDPNTDAKSIEYITLKYYEDIFAKTSNIVSEIQFRFIVEIGDGLDYSLNVEKEEDYLKISIDYLNGLVNTDKIKEYVYFEIIVSYYSYVDEEVKEVNLSLNTYNKASIYLGLESLYDKTDINAGILGAFSTDYEIIVDKIQVRLSNSINPDINIVPIKTNFEFTTNSILDSYDSESDSYAIETEREFLNAMYLISNGYNHMNFHLISDINFPLYTKIISDSMPLSNYYGTFEGNYHSISRINLNHNSLFDNLYGDIKNLTIENFVDADYGYTADSVIATNNYGGLYFTNVKFSRLVNISNDSYSALVITNHSTIYNCSANLNVSFNGVRFGGLVDNNKSSVKNSTVSGYVEAVATTLGGVVCTNDAAGNIENCSVYASINTLGETKGLEVRYGGVVSINYGFINNCFFGSKTNSKTILKVNSKIGYVGGIVAYNIGKNISIIENCTVENADISLVGTSYTNVGGIAGYTLPGSTGLSSIDYSEITNCVVANSKITGDNVVGGIVGISNGLVEYCRVDANTYIYGNADYSLSYVGGIAGNGSTLVNNSSYANITAKNTSSSIMSVGGIVGDLGLNEKCYGSIFNGTINTSGYSRTGGIAGYVGYTNYFYSNSSFGSITSKGTVGGVVGVARSSTLQTNNSSVKIYFTPSLNACAGGIVGEAISCKININNSTVTIEIKDNPNTFYVGGIAGKTENGELTNNTFKKGTIIYNVASEKNKSLLPYIGHLVGYKLSTTASNNTFSGNVFNVSNLIVSKILFITEYNQLKYCDTDADGFGYSK